VLVALDCDRPWSAVEAGDPRFDAAIIDSAFAA
jgi:hypothetical protein